jgi:chromosome segregation ATPase
VADSAAAKEASQTIAKLRQALMDSGKKYRDLQQQSRHMQKETSRADAAEATVTRLRTVVQEMEAEAEDVKEVVGGSQQMKKELMLRVQKAEAMAAAAEQTRLEATAAAEGRVSVVAGVKRQQEEAMAQLYEAQREGDEAKAQLQTIERQMNGHIEAARDSSTQEMAQLQQALAGAMRREQQALSRLDAEQEESSMLLDSAKREGHEVAEQLARQHKLQLKELESASKQAFEEATAAESALMQADIRAKEAAAARQVAEEAAVQLQQGAEEWAAERAGLEQRAEAADRTIEKLESKLLSRLQAMQNLREQAKAGGTGAGKGEEVGAKATSKTRDGDGNKEAQSEVEVALQMVEDSRQEATALRKQCAELQAKLNEQRPPSADGSLSVGPPVTVAGVVAQRQVRQMHRKTVELMQALKQSQATTQRLRLAVQEYEDDKRWLQAGGATIVSGADVVDGDATMVYIKVLAIYYHRPILVTNDDTLPSTHPCHTWCPPDRKSHFQLYQRHKNATQTRIVF